MNESLLRALTVESSWIAPSMVASVLLGAFTLARAQHPARQRIAAAMNIYAGALISILAVGHLLAVAIKISLGTVQGNPTWLWFIGIALLVPAALVTWHSRAIARAEAAVRGRTASLNLLLAVALLVTGPRNLPLALPVLFNAVYARHRTPWVGHSVVTANAIIASALLVGSLLFFASGGSFEEFSGMQAPAP